MTVQLETQKAQIAAEMQYTDALMKMGDHRDQLFRYAFARYGYQPPQGGAPAPLNLPDFMRQNGMVLNPSQPNGPAGNVQTGVSQNPSLAALIPGANPNPQGVVQPNANVAALAPPTASLSPGSHSHCPVPLERRQPRRGDTRDPN